MIRLGIRVRAADAEVAFARLEPVLARGAEEVALGDDVEFAIYGDDVPDARLRELCPALLSVSRSPVRSDWDTAWHEHLTPVTVGALTIRPPWIPGDGIVIDPGTSFGAASHATTRLCLELLQELPRGPLADWGTGSGILAIAAAKLGFAPVTALELDPAAAALARANAAANDVAVEVIAGDVLEDPPWAATIVANLTLPLLEAAARAAAAASDAAARRAAGPGAVSRPVASPGGGSRPPVGRGAVARLVVSGVLARQAGAAVAAWAPLGFVERERRQAGGWAAIVLERA